MRHIDVHGDNVRLQRFGHRDRFTAVLGGANYLQLVVTAVNVFQHLAHEGGVVHNQHADFLGGGCHLLSTPQARPGVTPPFP